MQANTQAYDQAKTVFSPDGRLFQVEYAREAVKRGTPAIGVKFDQGVCLVVDKRLPSPLIVPMSIEKIFKIDHHVCCATSGLVADARVLVERARTDAQMERVTYGEEVPVAALVKRIGDFKHSYAQAGGVRPFGTALLIGGVDSSGPHLYETDPSGATIGQKAAAVGSGRNAAVEILEDAWEPKMSQSAAMKLALKALAAAKESELHHETIELTVVSRDQDFHHIDAKTIEKMLVEIKKEGTPEVKGEPSDKGEDKDV